MFTKAFLKAAGERAVRSVIVILAGLITLDGEWPSFEDLWHAVVAGVIASLAMSAAGQTLNSEPGPSLIGAEVTSPPAVVPGEAGAITTRALAIAALVVALFLVLVFVILPAVRDDDDGPKDGRHGFDWEKSPDAGRGFDWERVVR